MKQPQKANFKRITLKKNLNEAIYKKIQKKIINTGRWSEEEHKLFEKNYICYLQKKITFRNLKESIPTRTKAQTNSHFNKKRYELERKYSAVDDKKIKSQILLLNKFFEKERNEKPAKFTQLIYLRDEIKKKNYVISLENFVLLKKFFPTKTELKLDFQAIHNFLLAVKTEREYTDMVLRHDAQMNRNLSYLGTNTNNKRDPSTSISSNSSYSNCTLSPSKHTTPSESFNYENFFLTNKKKEKNNFESALDYNNSSKILTADCTPVEAKVIPANASIPDNESLNKCSNFISELGNNGNKENAEIVKKQNYFFIKYAKCLNFNYDEKSKQNTNNKKEIPNNISYNLNSNNNNHLLSINSNEIKNNLKNHYNPFHCDKQSNFAYSNDNAFDSDNSNLDGLDPNYHMLKITKNDETSSEFDSFYNSKSGFPSSNSEDIYTDDNTNFFKFNYYSDKIITNQHSSILNNNSSNFHLAKSFEDTKLNQDSSLLFNNLIFTLGSNANNNLISNTIDDENHEKPNTLLSDSINSNANDNFPVNITNKGFNSNYLFEADFYKENNIFKLDHQFNFFC